MPVKFFSTKNTSSGSMDDYLNKMKKLSDALEDIGVPLPELVVVWYTLKNLSKEYDILKKMILLDKLFSFENLELHFLFEEIS
jgi:hypothetical protein